MVLHPLRERLWGQRMLALYRSGRQADALAAFDELRRALDEQLGLIPGPALQQLQQSILRQDAALWPPVPAEPHKGAAGAGAFVGRERELAALAAAFTEAQGGQGALVVVAGEPGIGKSRLADEFSRQVRHTGSRVHWGRSWEAGGAPAYWPWVQALRALIRGTDEGILLEWAGGRGAELANLLPELRGLLPDLPESGAVDSDGARFRLFEQTATLLRAVAAAEPVVIVLDDLHAADVPSMLLLEFLAVDLGDAPVMFVATYRDSEAPAAVTDLLRVARARIALGRLSEQDVMSLIEVAAAGEKWEQDVATIMAEADGNPLFVGELVRLLEAARGDSLPHDVKNVIARRVDGLPALCVAILENASVLGREFSLTALAPLSGTPVDELMDTLAAAVHARVLIDMPDAPASLRFAHTLIRDALYERLRPSRRSERHRAAGGVLAALYANDPDPHLSELAHHFFLGAAGGDSERAVLYGRLAAQRATRLLAHEEAVRLYQRTLGVLELSPPADTATRCELLLALGEAQMRSGDMASAKTTFLEAADIAGRTGPPDLVARAALGYGGPFVLDRSEEDRRIVPLLEDALARMTPGAELLRVRLLARLAGVLRRDRPDRAAMLSAEAVALARTIGDDATLGYALDASFATKWRSADVSEWLALADEIVAVAHGIGDREREFQGRHHRIAALMHLGDVPAADRELAELVAIAEELQQPAELWFARTCEALRAAFGGDYMLTEDRIFDALAHAERSAHHWDVASMHLIQLYGLRREQDRLAEIEEELDTFLRRDTSRLLYRCLLVDLDVRRGREGSAQQQLADLGTHGFGELVNDNEGDLGLALLSETCHALADEAHAAELYELLLPHDGRNVTSYPELSVGSVSRYLGLLAETSNRPLDAAKHYDDALAQNGRMGARPWLAHTQHDYGSFLLASGEVDRGRALLDQAATAAKAIGMGALTRGGAAALNLVATEVRTEPTSQDIIT